MSQITIEEQTMPLDEVEPNWIAEQINRRQADGGSVCVRVVFDEPDLKFTLSTPTCGSAGGVGGRPPRGIEQEIVELWNKHRLNEPNFSGGNVVAFVKELLKLL